MTLRGRKPMLIAAASQIAAVLAVLAVVQIHFRVTGEDLPFWGKIVLASGTASAVAALFRAGLGWIVFMAALPALFAMAVRADLPLWIPGGILVLMALALRNVIGDRVPLYLSNRETMEKLATLLGPDSAAGNRPVRILDLGCGTGSVPLAMARIHSHPDSRFVGVENAPIPFLIARARAVLSGDRRVLIRWQSLWDADLAGYDLIYAFLSPHPMADLFEKVRRGMTPGGIFVSNSFEVPGHEPDRRMPIQSGRATALLIWQIRGDV